MRFAPKFQTFAPAIIGAMTAVAIAVSALAQDKPAADKADDDSSRGVRILDAPSPTAPSNAAPNAAGPGAPGAPATAKEPAAAPSALAPSTSAKIEPAPAAPLSSPAMQAPVAAPLLTPSPAPPASPAAIAPALAPSPGAAPALPATPPPPKNLPSVAALEALSQSVNVSNPAALTLDILPGPDIALDSQVAFRVTTKKAGYLILVDVDPTGKLSQIYPNPMSLMAKASRAGNNFIHAGETIRLPDPRDSSGFEFVASPPTGTAMVAAFLSDVPVQVMDLPDLPAASLGSAAAANRLLEFANELRIADAAGKDALQEAHWSMSVRFYAIR